MTYTYPPEEYIRQLKAYNELEKMTFSPEDSREYILAKLEERSAKKRVIADVANTMIREYIETFEKDPEALTGEDVEKLESISEQLFPDGGLVGDIGATDLGIFYRITKLLLGYWRKQGDLSRYILALNRTSLGHMVLINGHTYASQTFPYQEEGLALASRLNTGELSEKARTKLLVILGRLTITEPDHFPLEQIRFIFDTLNANMPDPPTAYMTYNLVFCCSTILQLFREHFFYAKDHGIEFDAEQSYPLLREVAASLRMILEQNPGFDTVGDLSAYLLINDFFLGDIALEELLKGIRELQLKLADNPNPAVQAQGLGPFSYHYLNMLYRYSDAPREEIVRRSLELVREVLPKLKNVTRMVNDVNFNRYIVEFLNAASLTGSFDEFAGVILESTIYADKPLYIHTEMVREMSRAIFDHMIQATPEVFDGVAGKDTAYIREHVEEMKRLLDECCLFHDIGKFYMLDIVENSMRRLTDDEFGLIKMHPGYFENIYQTVDDRDERVLCIRDCALTHHLWHDGTKGYPNVPQTKNRAFADILAIADSIDAATDFLGRPYNSGKSIDRLISEFQAEAGTHYGPEAAAALSVPEVRNRLEYLITEGRREIYYRIYAFNKL